jgi:hypothetical protein
MTTVVQILSAVDFWKFAIPLLGAVIAWFTNEYRKRVADQYQRKEANYKELVRSLRGFYDGAANASSMKAEFLNQLNISWLYCPDEVIRKGYAYVDTVHAKKVHTDEEKENAMGAFVAVIRTDLLSRQLVRNTALTAGDFRHLNATQL